MREGIKKVLKSFRRFFVGDFKQLLTFLVLLFVFRPYDFGVSYITIWHLFFAGVLLSAVFNCHHTKNVKILALVLGIPTLMINWWSLFDLKEWIFLLGLVFSLIFLIFAIFSLIYRVLLEKVNADIIRGTICVYFMIGFAFSLLFTLTELLYPGSFAGLTERSVSFFHRQYHAEMVYFSFITLLTIGYGDIYPLSDFAQMSAVSEGLIGRFYVAILVARIVSIYARRARQSYSESLKKSSKS